MKKKYRRKRRQESTPLLVNVARDQSFEGKLELNTETVGSKIYENCVKKVSRNKNEYDWR